MTDLITDPAAIGTAADELQGIGAALEATNTAAAAATTGVLPPATDSVSVRTAAFLDAQAAQYQALSAQAELFHNQFVQTLITAQNAYAETEVSNAAALNSPSSNQIALIMGGTGNPTPSTPICRRSTKRSSSRSTPAIPRRVSPRRSSCGRSPASTAKPSGSRSKRASRY